MDYLEIVTPPVNFVDITENIAKFVRDQLYYGCNNAVLFNGWSAVSFHKDKSKVKFSVDGETRRYKAECLIAVFEDDIENDFSVNIFETESSIDVFLVFQDDTVEKSKITSFTKPKEINTITVQNLAAIVLKNYLSWIDSEIFSKRNSQQQSTQEQIQVMEGDTQETKMEAPQLPQQDFMRHLKAATIIPDCTAVAFQTVEANTGKEILVHGFVPTKNAHDFIKQAAQAKCIGYDASTASFVLSKGFMIN